MEDQTNNGLRVLGENPRGAALIANLTICEGVGLIDSRVRAHLKAELERFIAGRTDYDADELVAWLEDTLDGIVGTFDGEQLRARFEAHYPSRFAVGRVLSVMTLLT